MGAALQAKFRTEAVWIRESVADDGPGDMCSLLRRKWDYDQGHYTDTGKWHWQPGAWDEALVPDARSE